jgi:hypothetical protein
LAIIYLASPKANAHIETTTSRPGCTRPDIPLAALTIRDSYSFKVPKVAVDPDFYHVARQRIVLSTSGDVITVIKWIAKKRYRGTWRNLSGCRCQDIAGQRMLSVARQ